MRSKESPTEIDGKNNKNANFSGKLFGPHFLVQLTCGKMFFGWRFHWKIFIAPVRSRTVARKLFIKKLGFCVL